MRTWPRARGESEERAAVRDPRTRARARRTDTTSRSRVRVEGSGDRVPADSCVPRHGFYDELEHAVIERLARRWLAQHETLAQPFTIAFQRAMVTVGIVAGT